MSIADVATTKTSLAHTFQVCYQTKVSLIFVHNPCIQVILSLSSVCPFIADFEMTSLLPP